MSTPRSPARGRDVRRRALELPLIPDDFVPDEAADEHVLDALAVAEPADVRGLLVFLRPYTTPLPGRERVVIDWSGAGGSRALRASLVRLQAAGLVERDSPGEYELTPPGMRRLGKVWAAARADPSCDRSGGEPLRDQGPRFRTALARQAARANREGEAAVLAALRAHGHPASIGDVMARIDRDSLGVTGWIRDEVEAALARMLARGRVRRSRGKAGTGYAIARRARRRP